MLLRPHGKNLSTCLFRTSTLRHFEPSSARIPCKPFLRISATDYSTLKLSRQAREVSSKDQILPVEGQLRFEGQVEQHILRYVDQLCSNIGKCLLATVMIVPLRKRRL